MLTSQKLLINQLCLSFYLPKLKNFTAIILYLKLLWSAITALQELNVCGMLTIWY